MCDTRSCGRDETPLCRPCFKRVSRQLELLPALYVECEHMLVARPKREVERVRGGLPGSATINEAAVSARSAIMSTLASLAGLVRDERPVAVVLRREVTPLAAFLRVHLDWLAEHPAARELCDEIDDAVGMAQRVVHPEVGQEAGSGEVREPRMQQHRVRDVPCGARPLADSGELRRRSCHRPARVVAPASRSAGSAARGGQRSGRSSEHAA